MWCFFNQGPNCEVVCQVRTSTTDSKRSFLQKKGLTEAEIDDAFKRVPEASDTTVGAPVSTTSQLAEASRPQKPFPTATASGPYQPYQSQTAVQQAQQALQPGYRWSQVLQFSRTMLQNVMDKAGHIDHCVGASAGGPRCRDCGCHSLGYPELCSATSSALVQKLHRAA